MADPPSTELSRLSPPRFGGRLVTRDRLATALARAAAPLVVVAAPAGYGKTVTLTQWARQEARPVAWLQLDGGDNDPQSLLRHLAQALDPVAGTAVPVAASLASHPRLRGRALALLAGAVLAAAPFLLVLDDAQSVDDADSWGLVSVLLDHLPDGAAIAVGTRALPPLALPRRRAHGELFELQSAELAFDRDEVRALLANEGVTAGPHEIDALLAATEGWAAGLYLSALAGRTGDPDDLLSDVVDQLDGPLQRFLMETSILDRLTAQICAEVTGREDAGLILASLSRSNVFVRQLDDRDQVFRYHRLFGDYLRDRLERQFPDEVAGLHRRAAAWLVKHEDPAAAVDHWLAAGDIESAVGSAVLGVDECLNDGRNATARRLIESFTEGQILAHPPLAVSAFWVYGACAGTPEEEVRWTRLMRTYPIEDGSPSLDSAKTLLSSYRLILGELAPDGLTQMRDCAAYSMQVEVERPDDWYVMSRSLHARALYLLGDAHGAERELQALRDDLVDEFDRAGLGAMLALIAMDRGRWKVAEAELAPALAVEAALDFDLEPAYTAYISTQLAYLRLLAHRGDPETMSVADRVDCYAARMVHQAPWTRLLVDVTLGEVALEQGDVERAAAWSARALDRLKSYPDAGILEVRARRLEELLAFRRACDDLTPAELRVLALLPTHLTTQGIARQLGIAKSTVDTQSRAVYRKLGVSSRAGAVEKAREVGLL